MSQTEKPTCETCPYGDARLPRDDDDRKMVVCRRHAARWIFGVDRFSEGSDDAALMTPNNFCGEHPDFPVWLAAQRPADAKIDIVRELQDESDREHERATAAFARLGRVTVERDTLRKQVAALDKHREELRAALDVAHRIAVRGSEHEPSDKFAAIARDMLKGIADKTDKALNPPPVIA